jgi:transposase-like protein
MEKLIDSTNGEFSRVFDYHLEIVRSNPGSRVAVELNPDVVDKPVFARMYVCFEACMKGFLAGCRKVVGLDGCFLKGAVSGQLLCAIGRDANNQMYPIAWATVERENYDSWYWFLALLQKDIQINNNGEGFVIISDQQKGLIKAVNEIIPQAEHRMCARHIYANWRKSHRDKLYQKIFWACAKAFDRVGFNYHRAKLAQKTEQGAKDMMKTDPEHWSRAFFKFGLYCDSVENNLCESFNNAIMRARFYPIITSMEIIRKKVMVRIQENRAKSAGWLMTHK